MQISALCALVPPVPPLDRCIVLCVTLVKPFISAQISYLLGEQLSWDIRGVVYVWVGRSTLKISSKSHEKSRHSGWQSRIDRKNLGSLVTSADSILQIAVN